jgi:hypothetical protein
MASYCRSFVLQDMAGHHVMHLRGSMMKFSNSTPPCHHPTVPIEGSEKTLLYKRRTSSPILTIYYISRYASSDLHQPYKLLRNTDKLLDKPTVGWLKLKWYSVLRVGGFWNNTNCANVSLRINDVSSIELDQKLEARKLAWTRSLVARLGSLEFLVKNGLQVYLLQGKAQRETWSEVLQHGECFNLLLDELK